VIQYLVRAECSLELFRCTDRLESAELKTLSLWVFAFTALALTPLASPARAADSPSALDIFAKHAASVGYSLSAGTEAPYVIARETKWTDKKGDHAYTSLEKRAGAYSYFAITRDGVSETYGFDGHSFWNADVSGNVTTEIGYGRPFDVTASVMESEAYDASVNPQLQPSVGADYVVRINPPSGVPADIFFNQKTYTIDKTIIDPGRETITTEYSNFHQYGPALIAKTRKTGDATTTVTKFEWNAPLQTTDFLRPVQHSYATFPESGSASETFDTRRYPGIVINATINGVPGRFLVDTGSSALFINPTFAKRAQLITYGQGSAETIEGYEGFKFARVPSLKVGGFELRGFAAIVPERDFGAHEFDGLIGYSVLDQAVFSIDFDANTITFSNPSTFVPPASAGYIVIGVDGGTPQIRATVNTTVPVFMDLDLGASGISLIFTKSFLQSNPGIVQGDMRGNGGMMGTLAQIDFGPFQFFGLSAGVLTTDAGFGGEKVLQGLIGYETLRRFNLTFDYQSNKLYFALNKYGKDTRFTH
jgi:aspartyl protease